MALRRPNGTEALGIAGVGLTIGATVLEWAHLRRLEADRRRFAAAEPDPEVLRLFDHPLDVGAEAAREAVAVVRSGYVAGSRRENATLNLLLSYALTFAAARASTHLIRSHGGTFGPLRNRSLGGRHIHHFVPGILLAFSSGAAAIVRRDPALDPLLAVPFGAGMALVLDEAALLVDLEDVYWTDRGVLSVQLTLGTMAGLGAFTVALRVVRRGEREVLEG